MGVVILVDLDGAADELDRLAKGPDSEAIGRMETGLMAGFSLSDAKVHEITGYLKSTGHPESHYAGGEWYGVMSWARYPGIFELARANTPSRNHPEGGHYFMDEGGPLFLREVRHAIWDWITGGDLPAPSLGLGPFSGGDD
jgi:hypothetical protein